MLPKTLDEEVARSHLGALAIKVWSIERKIYDFQRNSKHRKFFRNLKKLKTPLECLLIRKVLKLVFDKPFKETQAVPSKFLNVYDLGMEMYTFRDFDGRNSSHKA